MVRHVAVGMQVVAMGGKSSQADTKERGANRWVHAHERWLIWWIGEICKQQYWWWRGVGGGEVVVQLGK